MLIHKRTTPDREPWYAVDDQSGQVYGPFDPGALWFETPATVRGSKRLQLQRTTDLILSEAHAGWERLQRTLAFLQPRGLAAWRRFQECGIVPEQTPALAGLSGGIDVPAYLGDGDFAGMGLHVDDSNNGTTLDGFPGVGPGTGSVGASGPPGKGPGGDAVPQITMLIHAAQGAEAAMERREVPEAVPHYQ